MGEITVQIDATAGIAENIIIVTCGNCQQSSQESYSSLVGDKWRIDRAHGVLKADPYDFVSGYWYHKECPTGE